MAFTVPLWLTQQTQGHNKQPCELSSFWGMEHSDQVSQRLSYLIQRWVPCQTFDPLPNNNQAES